MRPAAAQEFFGKEVIYVGAQDPDSVLLDSSGLLLDFLPLDSSGQNEKSAPSAYPSGPAQRGHGGSVNSIDRTA